MAENLTESVKIKKGDHVALVLRESLAAYVEQGWTEMKSHDLPEPKGDAAGQPAPSQLVAAAPETKSEKK